MVYYIIIIVALALFCINRVFDGKIKTRAYGRMLDIAKKEYDAVCESLTSLNEELLEKDVLIKKAIKENKAKSTWNSTMLGKIKKKDDILNEYVRISDEAMGYIKENAYFDDVESASLFFVRWADTVELLKKK